MELKCRDCDEDDPSLIAMTWDKRYGVNRSRGYCRSCFAARQLARKKSSPEATRRQRDSNLRSKYNISLGEVEEMLKAQGGVCAICERVAEDRESRGAWRVDHDHSCCPGKNSCGKCVRGILCNGCNVALGLLGDRVDILMSAAAYLIRTGKDERVATG